MTATRYWPGWPATWWPTDVKDNIYPRKERAENKIDGIVALIMALSRAIKPGDSVVLGSDYELMLL